MSTSEPESSLYDRDFYTWAKRQAAALEARDVEAIDWENGQTVRPRTSKRGSGLAMGRDPVCIGAMRVCCVHQFRRSSS